MAGKGLDGACYLSGLCRKRGHTITALEGMACSGDSGRVMLVKMMARPSGADEFLKGPGLKIRSRKKGLMGGQGM